MLRKEKRLSEKDDSLTSWDSYFTAVSKSGSKWITGKSSWTSCSLRGHTCLLEGRGFSSDSACKDRAARTASKRIISLGIYLEENALLSKGKHKSYSWKSCFFCIEEYFVCKFVLDILYISKINFMGFLGGHLNRKTLYPLNNTSQYPPSPSPWQLPFYSLLWVWLF